MNHSALIIFAKLPRAGEVKTRLGESIGMEQAAKVYKEFAEHAFTLADGVNAKDIVVYIFYAPGASEIEIKQWVGRPFHFIEQRGNSLGDRMRNAFDRTFADGATQTVIIGTDVPELDARTLHSSFAYLTSHDIVIGPSTDGGYYLLGMNVPTKDVFDGIVWSSSAVTETTLARIEAGNYSFALLPVLSDIDTEEDYRAYVQRRASARERNQ